MINKKNKHPFVLVILDGFGQALSSRSNAIFHAYTPHLEEWFKTYPHTTLTAAGKAVGLPEGYIGNSEVGHLTIGSGRIILQNLVRINTLIHNKKLKNHHVIKSCFSQLAATKKTLHIMGLLSDAGVHSHISHLFAYIDLAIEYGITYINIHPFLDGRDVPPKSSKKYLKKLEKKIANFPSCQIASIIGRFYAMDRDHNWKRTQQIYTMFTEQHKPQWSGWQDALAYYYKQNITDEFIPPTPLFSTPLIQENDGILFLNFRPDRAHQLTASFTDPNFSAFSKKTLALSFFITPTDYNSDHYVTQTLLKKINIQNTLKEILSQNNKTIFTIAETEKYAHVTYFFNGGKKDLLPNETRVLVPSVPTKNYIDFPQMSARHITQKVIESLKTNTRDFYLINYANADMVGHSGNFKATVKAIECLDEELKKLYDIVVEEKSGTLIITSDHGNAENMFNTQTGQPQTAHTVNPVPFIVINKNLKNKNISLKLKGLSDIAPFILEKMILQIPIEMKKSDKIKALMIQDK